MLVHLPFQAYLNYYTSTNDYNRAQSRLFHALGYLVQKLACGNALGAFVPVDPSRQAPLPPVHAPEPCHNWPR
jgi:hypothetical protein